MNIHSDIEVYPPFAPLTVKKSIHYTYLDTKGRPALTLYYKNLTDRHAGFVYVRSFYPSLSVNSDV